MKDAGIINANQSMMFGCLNPACAWSFESGLLLMQFAFVIYLGVMVFLNFFSIGLVSHTLKFDIHNKSQAFRVVAFFGFLALTSLSIFFNYETTFPQIQVDTSIGTYDPESIQLPQTLLNDVNSAGGPDTDWFPLEKRFSIFDSCQASVQQDGYDVCNELEYKVTLQALGGNLKLKGDNIVEKPESVLSEYTVEGTKEEINEIIENTLFAPHCSAIEGGTLGAMTLLLTAEAKGPMAKTQMQVQVLPDGEKLTVKGTAYTKIYNASHQMNAFRPKDKMSVYGRVIDMAGRPIYQSKQAGFNE